MYEPHSNLTREGPDLHDQLREPDMQPTKSVSSVHSSFMDTPDVNDDEVEGQSVSSLDTIELLSLSQESTTGKLEETRDREQQTSGGKVSSKLLKQMEHESEIPHYCPHEKASSMKSLVEDLFDSIEQSKQSRRRCPSGSRNRPAPPRRLGKVLVVDEQALSCETLDGFFMVMNFRDRQNNISYVHSGLQALDSINRALTEPQEPYTYNLIMVDCSLPVLNGFETAKLIRTLYKKHGIPRSEQPKIVGMHERPDEKMKAKAKENGMDILFPKLMPLDNFCYLLLSVNLIDEVPTSISTICGIEDI